MIKTIKLLSYCYPGEVSLLIGGVIYRYQTSEFWARRFLNAWERGGRFNSLSWFKRVAKVIEKEVIGKNHAN